MNNLPAVHSTNNNPQHRDSENGGSNFGSNNFPPHPEAAYQMICLYNKTAILCHPDREA